MSVTDSDVVVDQRQVTVGDVEAIIINEVTVFDIENTGSTTTAIATGSTSNNLIQSVVIGNVLDPDLTDPSDPGDPGFVPGSSTLDVSLATGTGPSSNAVIASVQELTAASVFGAIRGTNEITTDPTPPSNETVTLGVNTISSAVVLQEAENRLTGILDPTFNNTDAGSVVINTLDAADGSAILGPGDLDTGLLIGNVQVVREVDSGTSNALGVDAFASVAGTASIANIIDGNFGSNLSVIADENTIGAFFEGNAAVNVLDVEAGGGNTLNSAAGIASVQISDRVESGSGSNAVIDVDTGRISVNIFSPNPNRSLDDSTLSFANNTVTATATGNTVFSDVNLADGISFDGPSDGALAINSVQPDESSNSLDNQADLFVVNVQQQQDSPISARVEAISDRMRVDIAEGMSGSDVFSDNNVISAQATANAAEGAITVVGAESFDSTVAATSLQSFEDRLDDASGSSVQALSDSSDIVVAIGGSSAAAISDAEVSMRGNTVSSRVAAAESSLNVQLSADLAVTDDGLQGPPQLELNDVSDELTSNAGISALTGQLVLGADSVDDRIAVSSETLDATVSLQIGNATAATLSTVTATQSSNRIASEAVGLSARTSVDISSSGVLDASNAVGSKQLTTYADVTATTSGVVSSRMDAPSLDATTLVLRVGDADLSNDDPDDPATRTGNRITATALGQGDVTTLDANATGTRIVSGGIDTSFGFPPALVTLGGLTAPEKALAAEMALLGDQGLNGSTVDANVSEARISGSIDQGTNALDVGTLALDGNEVSALAEGNTAQDTLRFSANDFDLAEANADSFAFTQTAETNLAALARSQTSNGASQVTARVGASADSEITAVTEGTGAVSNLTQSLSSNAVTATARGSSSELSLAGSGTDLGSSDETDFLAFPDSTTRLGLRSHGVEGDVRLSGATVGTGLQQRDGAEVSRNVSTTLRQWPLEFRLGFLRLVLVD